MDFRMIIFLFFFIGAFKQMAGQYLSRYDLESLDSCYYCENWRIEHGFSRDSLHTTTYFDENGRKRRYQEFDNLGVCLTLFQLDATRNESGLGYQLDANYSTLSYWINGGGTGVFYYFSPDQKLIEQSFSSSYGALHFHLTYDNKGRITSKAEIAKDDAYLWHYWIYDKKGTLRKEGFTYNKPSLENGNISIAKDV
jgi:hypothetical protein